MVRIVFCKECEYRNSENCPVYTKVEDTDYCSFGELKKEDLQSEVSNLPISVGYWIHFPKDVLLYRCDHCGNEVLCTKSKDLPLYCSECGAKMIGSMMLLNNNK